MHDHLHVVGAHLLEDDRALDGVHDGVESHVPPLADHHFRLRGVDEPVGGRVDDDRDVLAVGILQDAVAVGVLEPQLGEDALRLVGIEAGVRLHAAVVERGVAADHGPGRLRQSEVEGLVDLFPVDCDRQRAPEVDLVQELGQVLVGGLQGQLQVALERPALPGQDLVVAGGLAFLHDLVVLEALHAAALDVDLPLDDRQRRRLLVGQDPDVDVVDVRELVARGVDHGIVRVAGGAGPVDVIELRDDPGTDLRHGAGIVHEAKLGVVLEVLVGRVGVEPGVELLGVVLGVQRPGSGHVQGHVRVGDRGDVLDRVVVDLLHLDGLAAGVRPPAPVRVDVRVVADVLHGPDDVVRGQGMAVRPLGAPAVPDGELGVVVVELVFRGVQRVQAAEVHAVVQVSRQVVGDDEAEAAGIAQAAVVVQLDPAADGVGRPAAQRAAVLADLAQHLPDQRLLGDALRDRRQVARGHHLGQHGRLAVVHGLGVGGRAGEQAREGQCDRCAKCLSHRILLRARWHSVAVAQSRMAVNDSGLAGWGSICPRSACADR